MEGLLIGLDLGTSAVKVGVFDLRGRVLAMARAPYPTHTPCPGWVEQEPADWWLACVAALRQVLGEVEPGRLVALGLSGQAPSQIMLDDNGEPLGRALLWSDRRATLESAWVRDHISSQQAYNWTGYRFISDASQPPARLRWLQVHRPDEWARCAAFVQPKDFIAARLTGRVATDSVSSFTLYDPRAGRYHADYLAQLDVEPAKMPPVISAADVVATVTPAAAAQTGLPAGLPVVCGTIDAWCAILGCGGTQAGVAVDVTGTSETVALLTNQLVDGDGVYGSLLLDDLFWIGGPMQAGSGVLDWLAHILDQPDASLDRLEVAAAGVPAGSDSLLFLPYLRGERTPHWDSQARGAFVGLSADHTQGHLARAVYEGVAFAVRDVLARCQTAAGLAPAALHVSGGGARSALWNQIKADVIGVPVQEMAVPDAACLGAALLAGLGTRTFGSLVEAAAALVHTAEVHHPRPEVTRRYDALFETWRQLYADLRPTFARLDAIREERVGR